MPRTRPVPVPGTADRSLLTDVLLCLSENRSLPEPLRRVLNEMSILTHPTTYLDDPRRDRARVYLEQEVLRPGYEREWRFANPATASFLLRQDAPEPTNRGFVSPPPSTPSPSPVATNLVELERMWRAADSLPGTRVPRTEPEDTQRGLPDGPLPDLAMVRIAGVLYSDQHIAEVRQLWTDVQAGARCSGTQPAGGICGRCLAIVSRRLSEGMGPHIGPHISVNEERLRQVMMYLRSGRSVTV